MFFEEKSYPAPVFFGKSIPIALNCSNEYFPYLFVTMVSLMAHTSEKNNYDITILSAGISNDNQQAMRKLIGERKNFSLRFIEIGELLVQQNFFTRDHYRPIIYARLLLPELMRNYSGKLIYLDSDLIINTDIAELYDLVQFENDELIAAVRDIGMITVYHTEGRPEKKYLNQFLKLKHPENYFNSGVLVFNLPIFRSTYSIDFLLQYATQQKWVGQDQDIFSTLCDGKVLLLPQEWNLMIQFMHCDDGLGDRATPTHLKERYMDARKNPKIIHYIENKFLLMDPPCDLFYYFWYYARQTAYYEELLARMAKAHPIFQPDDVYKI